MIDVNFFDVCYFRRATLSPKGSTKMQGRKIAVQEWLNGIHDQQMKDQMWVPQNAEPLWTT